MPVRPRPSAPSLTLKLWECGGTGRRSGPRNHWPKAVGVRVPPFPPKSLRRRGREGLWRRS